MKVIALIVAGVILFTFLATIISSFFPPAYAKVRQEEIDVLKGQASNIAKERQSLNSELAKLRDKKAGAVEKKQIYDRKIENLNKEIDTSSVLLAKLGDDIAERNAALEEAIQDAEEGREEFEARVSAMQKMGKPSYLAVLLEAKSFSDFLTRWDAMSRIIDYDNQLAEKRKEKCEAIAKEQKALEDNREDQLKARERLTASQKELASLSAESDRMIADTMSDIAENEKLAAEQEKAEQEAYKQILSLQEQLRKQIAEELRKAEAERRRREAEEKKAAKNAGSGEGSEGSSGSSSSSGSSTEGHKYVGGQYAWPVPGNYRISSQFGNRRHPVYGVTRFHGGIDIPAPSGTRVIAANAGTILTRGYNSGYGNYIVVDHGGGQASLYAHLSRFGSFGVGKSVKQGDTIGYVGTTGVSTGNHLHFEILQSGKRVNPEPLLRK